MYVNTYAHGLCCMHQDQTKSCSKHIFRSPCRCLAWRFTIPNSALGVTCLYNTQQLWRTLISSKSNKPIQVFPYNFVRLQLPSMYNIYIYTLYSAYVYNMYLKHTLNNVPTYSTLNQRRNKGHSSLVPGIKSTTRISGGPFNFTGVESIWDAFGRRSVPFEVPWDFV